MKNVLMCASALAISSSAAFAGGLDRSGQAVNILFEEGNLVNFSLSHTSPTIEGTLGGVPSGDVGESFYAPGFAFKYALSDSWDIAVIYDEPFGAHVKYGSNYPLSLNPVPGAAPSVLQAEATSRALTALVRYKFGNGFSAYAGPRIQRTKADVTVPRVAGYNVTTGNSTDVGYVVGAAWERPDIAARVALTYSSAIKHSLSQTETNSLGLNANTTSEIETPQSLNLDFQTGIAPQTLLFGTVRWVDWPQLSYNPPNYALGELVGYSNSTVSYSLGVGRQFTENFTGAIVLGYESSGDSPVTDLGPTDGNWSIGLAGTYEIDQTKFSAGIRYTDIGDATTKAGAKFSGNSALSVGFQITYAFN